MSARSRTSRALAALSSPALAERHHNSDRESVVDDLRRPESAEFLQRPVMTMSGVENCETEAESQQMQEAEGTRVRATQVCEQTRKSIKHVELTVLAEVAKHWRASDEKRERIEQVAHEAIEEALEHLGRTRSVLMDSVEKLEGFSRITSCLGCRVPSDLVVKLQRLISKQWDRSSVAELEQSVKEKQRQIAVLQEANSRMEAELEQMQRKYAEQQRELVRLRTEREPAKSSAGEVKKVPGEDRINACEASQAWQALEEIRVALCDGNSRFQSGHVLLPERPIWTSQQWKHTSTRPSPSEKQGQLRSIPSESDSELRSVRSCGLGDGGSDNEGFRQYLKYVALPEVGVYDGESKEYTFSNFLDMFSLKYPSDQWSDEELRAIFKAKLGGKARAQFEALPRVKKEGSFKALVEAMRAKCKGEQRTKRIVALGKLNELGKTDEQSVADFCIELERLAQKAYPELDEMSLATTRANLLYEQLVAWPESYHLLETLETGGDRMYDALKETAPRVERRRITLENANWLGSKGVEKGHTRRRNSREAHDDNVACETVPEKQNANGVSVQETKDVSSPGDARPIRCFKCNGYRLAKKHRRRTSRPKYERNRNTDLEPESSVKTAKWCGAVVAKRTYVAPKVTETSKVTHAKNDRKQPAAAAVYGCEESVLPEEEDRRVMRESMTQTPSEWLNLLERRDKLKCVGYTTTDIPIAPKIKRKWRVRKGVKGVFNFRSKADGAFFRDENKCMAVNSGLHSTHVSHPSDGPCSAVDGGPGNALEGCRRSSSNFARNVIPLLLHPTLRCGGVLEAVRGLSDPAASDFYGYLKQVFSASKANHMEGGEPKDRPGKPAKNPPDLHGEPADRDGGISNRRLRRTQLNGRRSQFKPAGILERLQMIQSRGPTLPRGRAS
ncbi:hypothetical protein ANCDUO_05150 [Ancylostoma duodenale]|uniref:Uncharacterized protein n=1 Tax=Ancylostoma duodenale TaxID=51022 RepID=A0A0C2D4T5_9BILA|nr:hypothetical protein ANCDUO_05150 [Ancylostoma duodenale]